jgi:transposase-like protein
MWAGELALGPQPSEAHILVILGAPENGPCELIALHSPIAASAAAWKQLLVNLMRRGLTKPPKIAVADRAIGFWPAITDFSKATRQQLSWDNEIAHLLSLLHKGMRRLAEKELRRISEIPNKEDAIKALDLLIADFLADAPEAAQCLQQDKDLLFTFHDFPADAAAALRTAGNVQSLFSGAEALLRDEKNGMEAKLNALLNLTQPAHESLKQAA